MKNLDKLKDIKGFNHWTIIEYINKGWSEDIKFYVVDENNNKYILRFSNIDLYKRKKLEYENLKELANFNLNMSTPMDFGICNNGTMVYMLLKWIEGEDAIEHLPTLSKIKQYNLGVEAGKKLRTIHSISPKSTVELWEDRFKIKIENGIGAYRECGISIDYDKDIINAIRENEIYLKDRPTTFQHGDYHLGNMIITTDKKLGIIDFNRSSFGDPWEEYDRFIFSWDNSIDFANGQIHGYFDNKVPDEFFRLMCLYNARNSLASIPWSVAFGQDELNVALGNIKKTYDSYNGYKTHIPNWYVAPEITPGTVPNV